MTTEPLNADALREYARLLAHEVADGPDGDKTSLQLAAKEIAQLKIGMEQPQSSAQINAPAIQETRHRQAAFQDARTRETICARLAELEGLLESAKECLSDCAKGFKELRAYDGEFYNSLPEGAGYGRCAGLVNNITAALKNK